MATIWWLKQYEQENQEWINFTKQKFGQHIEMLSISELSGNYRIYQHKNKIVKNPNAMISQELKEIKTNA